MLLKNKSGVRFVLDRLVVEKDAVVVMPEAKLKSLKDMYGEKMMESLFEVVEVKRTEPKAEAKEEPKKKRKDK